MQQEDKENNTLGKAAANVLKHAHNQPEEASELADMLLGIAINNDASDIHIDPSSTEIKISLRIYGVLTFLCTIPPKAADPLINRFKVLAGVFVFDQHLPQEGHVGLNQLEERIQLRVSTYPTIQGECVSIRIFRKNQDLYDIDSLNLPDSARESLANQLDAHDGLIILSGPSGSGKTTTLYASLLHIIKSGKFPRRIATVEDPIENTIPGVMQTQVNREKDMTFSSSLSSILRHDIDVIMVGEIRNEATAKTAVEASLTGHLVLSTVHAARNFTVPYRLLEMGVPPYALSGGLRLIIAQRLIRCYRDNKITPLSDDVIRKFITNPESEQALKNDKDFTGVKLLAEPLISTEKLRKAIISKSSLDTFVDIAAECGEQITEQAINSLREGITSWQEISRVMAGDESFCPEKLLNKR